MKNYEYKDADKELIIEFVKTLPYGKIYNMMLQEIPVTRTVGRNIFDNHMIDSWDYSMLGLSPVKFKIETPKQLPTQVFFNKKKKATTIMQEQKSTVVKCGKDEKYNKRIGFLEAYFQAYSGLSKTQANKYIKSILEEE